MAIFSCKIDFVQGNYMFHQIKCIRRKGVDAVHIGHENSKFTFSFGKIDTGEILHEYSTRIYNFVDVSSLDKHVFIKNLFYDKRTKNLRGQAKNITYVRVFGEPEDPNIFSTIQKHFPNAAEIDIFV